VASKSKTAQVPPSNAKANTAPPSVRIEPGKCEHEATRLHNDATTLHPHNVNLQYLSPLAKLACGHPLAEQYVSRVSKGNHDVATLSKLIESCLHSNAFPLMRDESVQPKHIGSNYSSSEEGRVKVTKALKKRLARGQTLGPYRLSADSLPFRAFACNSVGAVPKRDTPDLRPVDDVYINCAIRAPPLGMPSIAILREEATKGCWWWLVDVEDAFATLPVAASDRPFMLFRWYDVEDTEYNGTSHDCIYMHVRGNFGPRTLPSSEDE
jgi:hypothetical protein